MASHWKRNSLISAASQSEPSAYADNSLNVHSLSAAQEVAAARTSRMNSLVDMSINIKQERKRAFVERMQAGKAAKRAERIRSLPLFPDTGPSYLTRVNPRDVRLSPTIPAAPHSVPTTMSELVRRRSPRRPVSIVPYDPSYAEKLARGPAAAAAAAEGAGATLAGTGGKFLTGMNKNPLYKWGMTGGLGLVAMNRARKAYDSARNGDIGNAAVNTALAGAAGYGAYLAYLPHSQAASHLRRIQGGWLGRNVSHATNDIIKTKYGRDAANFVGNTMGGNKVMGWLRRGLSHI